MGKNSRRWDKNLFNTLNEMAEGNISKFQEDVLDENIGFEDFIFE